MAKAVRGSWKTPKRLLRERWLLAWGWSRGGREASGECRIQDLGFRGKEEKGERGKGKHQVKVESRV
jgi:hypothetical protein